MSRFRPSYPLSENISLKMGKRFHEKPFFPEKKMNPLNLIFKMTAV